MLENPISLHISVLYAMEVHVQSTKSQTGDKCISIHCLNAFIRPCHLIKSLHFVQILSVLCPKWMDDIIMIDNCIRQTCNRVVADGRHSCTVMLQTTMSTTALKPEITTGQSYIWQKFTIIDQFLEVFLQILNRKICNGTCCHSLPFNAHFSVMKKK